MRWKAHFFLQENEEDQESMKRENYGFMTKKCPPQCADLDNFEKDLMNVINKLEFKKINDKFQRKLKEDIKKVRESPNMLVFADKSTNVYELKPEDHQKFLQNNITKTYKKASEMIEHEINLEAKEIAEKLELEDRINCLGKAQAFITMKDHKEDFRANPTCRLINPTKSELGIISKSILDGISTELRSILINCLGKAQVFITMKDHKEDFHANPTCRLINPTKSELGKISKSILDGINTELRSILKVNQWKNTGAVIKWFNSIKEKESCAFIQLDIKDFYPTITEKILDNAISFAKELTHVSDEKIRIIKHCRKSLLNNNETPWVKKNTPGNFDVTMGSYDGAEVCELVGVYILSLLANRVDKEDTGLYRDDGLVIVRNLTGPQTDKTRKDIIKIFKEIGFKIEIKTNLKQVDFLDVTFNLNNSTYQPYKKEDNQLLYINTSSNHPPSIIKQIPTSISRRLSDNSSNEEIFNTAKTEHETALKNSGYSAPLSFTQRRPPKRQRKRNIIWFNPPYSKNVKTNIGKIFIKLINKHFPRSSDLHKIFQ